MVQVKGNNISAFFDFFRDAEKYIKELRAGGYIGELIAQSDMGIISVYEV